MYLLEAATVSDYLRSRGFLEKGVQTRVEVLSGGVSNVVIRVETDSGMAAVIKQSREQLRTAAPWFSRLDRIWRETATMAEVGSLLPAGAVPRILFEDRENYLYAMEAVDPRHTVWKEDLLAGRIRPDVAARLGDYLSAIHAGTHGQARLARDFDDREVFVQLRVDPFYRRIAAVHSKLRPSIEMLIDEMWQTRICLVHADFSPKNVLVVDRKPESPEPDLQVTLIDFETGHYGDPAFDLGFFLSHLMLKGVRAGFDVGRLVGLARTFWDRYATRIVTIAGDPAFHLTNLERRAVANLAGCALARIDGTSPVNYLPDPGKRDLVRTFCRQLFLERVEQLPVAFALLETAVLNS